MDNTKLKVINLFGAPGSGKSKIAQLISGLSYQYNCNIQYVKKHCWEQSHKLRFNNQMLITAEQYTKQLVLKENNISCCVTDSPILLGVLYSPENYFPSYYNLTKEAFLSFTNINFLIRRGNFSYENVGRNEDEEGSLLLELKQVELLTANGLPYSTLVNTDAFTVANEILHQVFSSETKI